MSSKTQNILILGNPEIHIDTVAEKLKQKGANVFHFSGWDNQQGLSINFTTNLDLPQVLFEIKEEDGINFYDINSFDAIWNRTKFGTKIEWTDVEDKLAHDYSQSQWKELFYSLETFVETSNWFDTFETVRKNSIKASQLHLAKTCKLQIPEFTYFTNSLKYITSLQDQTIVVKSMGPVYFPNQSLEQGFKIMPTTVFQTNSLSQHATELAVSPLIFQKLYERDRDLRITMVGKGKAAHCFAASIDILPHKSIDWREYQTETSIQFVDLKQFDSIFYEQLLEYHEKTALSYGAYDILLRKETDGKEIPIFLECNPIGNWLWLEHTLPNQLPISDSIAQMLINH